MAQAGGSRTVSNDVSAITPEIWSESIQEPLYKTLVSMEVCNTELKNELRYGDTINKQYFESLSAQAYVPGVAFTADAQEWDTDQLIVSAFKSVAIYVDDIEQLQANINIRTSLRDEIAYQLRDAIDTHALLRVKQGQIYGADDLIAGGIKDHAVTATTANVIDMFSKSRKLLRTLNVAEAGDWIAIVGPTIANLIETKSTSVGFNTADATLRNGYAGDFMGFKIYVSNNLPTGTAASAIGGSDDNVSAQVDGDFETSYIGRSKSIDLVIQKMPTIQINKVSDKHGYNIAAFTVYGDQVFTKNASRFLCVITV